MYKLGYDPKYVDLYKYVWKTKQPCMCTANSQQDGSDLSCTLYIPYRSGFSHGCDLEMMDRGCIEFSDRNCGYRILSFKTYNESIVPFWINVWKGKANLVVSVIHTLDRHFIDNVCVRGINLLLKYSLIVWYC